MKRKRSAKLKRTLQYDDQVEERETSMRGNQVDLEVENNVNGMMGNNYPNGLSQMIVSIINEISKESGGLANLSRSFAGNSVSNGQMGQPCGNLSTSLAGNSVSNGQMGLPRGNLSRSLAGNPVSNGQMGQPHGNLSRSLAGNSVSSGQMGQRHVDMGIEENESRPYQSSEYNEEELDAALAVIKKTMELDVADSFNRPVDPIALHLPVIGKTATPYRHKTYDET